MALSSLMSLAGRGYLALPTEAKLLLNPMLAMSAAGIGLGAAMASDALAGKNRLNTGGTTMPAGLNIIPGYDVNWANILPGGAPFITPEGPQMQWEYSHTANGINFYRFGNKRGCYTSKGVWKQWAVYHPIVFGKHADGEKLARIIKKHHALYKTLNKVFGKRERAASNKRR